MKFLIVCLLVGFAYAEISTIVTVNKAGIVGSTNKQVTIPCEYEMLPSEDQPPIIYWIKGVSVDDADAEIIFKGFRYWNESLGEYRQFFGDYEKRASVEDLKMPSIKITGLTVADEGRYWCMVAEWSGRQQEGTNAASSALMIDSWKPYLDVQTDVNVTVQEGDDVKLDCYSSQPYDTVTWYEGPFHLSDNENFTHTEIGTYFSLGSYYGSPQCDDDGCVAGAVMNESYPSLMIDQFRRLVFTDVRVADSGRYWCEVTNTTVLNKELQTDRSSVQLVVEGEEFECSDHTPGLYSDPEDCSMYYECVEGNSITYHRSCGYDGLVFDERNDYCDWAANVPPPCGTNSE